MKERIAELMLDLQDWLEDNRTALSVGSVVAIAGGTLLLWRVEGRPRWGRITSVAQAIARYEAGQCHPQQFSVIVRHFSQQELASLTAHVVHCPLLWRVRQMVWHQRTWRATAMDASSTTVPFILAGLEKVAPDAAATASRLIPPGRLQTLRLLGVDLTGSRSTPASTPSSVASPATDMNPSASALSTAAAMADVRPLAALQTAAPIQSCTASQLSSTTSSADQAQSTLEQQHTPSLTSTAASSGLKPFGPHSSCRPSQMSDELPPAMPVDSPSAYGQLLFWYTPPRNLFHPSTWLGISRQADLAEALLRDGLATVLPVEKLRNVHLHPYGSVALLLAEDSARRAQRGLWAAKAAEGASQQPQQLATADSKQRADVEAGTFDRSMGCRQQQQEQNSEAAWLLPGRLGRAAGAMTSSTVGKVRELLGKLTGIGAGT